MRSSMHTATKLSIPLLIISIGAIGWGVWYRGDHQFLAAGAAFGVENTTYTMAGWAAGLGLLAFLTGLALLVAGIVRGGRQTS